MFNTNSKKTQLFASMRHADDVTAVCWYSGKKNVYLVTGCKDNYVRVLRLDHKKKKLESSRMLDVGERVSALASLDDQGSVVVGTSAGTLILLNFKVCLSIQSPTSFISFTFF